MKEKQNNRMEEKKTMEYGRKYQVGNYMVLKYNKALRKSEVAELRTQMGVPSDLRKQLQRATLPFIKVFAVSGIWSIEFCCNTAVYRMLDEYIGEGGEQNEAIFGHLFNMWFMDTTVPGDVAYRTARAKAFKSFMERQKAAMVSDEEDGKILDSVKVEEEAKATLIDMNNGFSEANREGGGYEGQ